MVHTGWHGGAARGGTRGAGRAARGRTAHTDREWGGVPAEPAAPPRPAAPRPLPRSERRRRSAAPERRRWLRRLPKLRNRLGKGKESEQEASR